MGTFMRSSSRDRTGRHFCHLLAKINIAVWSETRLMLLRVLGILIEKTCKKVHNISIEERAD